MLTVVIQGASVAGCTAAILLREQGHRVVLLEKRTQATDYKKLCTHFVQPSAIPVLERIGLAERAVQAGGLPTKAALLTPAGWINRPGPYLMPDCQGHYALNIEREVLDPLLRERAIEAGVDLHYGTRCVELRQDPATTRWNVRTDVLGELRANLLVAADGRASMIAQMLGNPKTCHENQRATFYAYYDVSDTAFDRARSIFANHGREMAFLYPLSGERALLSVYLTKDRASDWRHDDKLDARLIAFCDEIEGFPALASARRLSPVYGYADYPSLERSPVWSGCAFVGDAAMSLDPMSGVGCAFAMQSAELLADDIAEALAAGNSVAMGLGSYQQRHADYFLAHARGIVADSRANRSNESLMAIYQTILASAPLQDDYLALTGRVLDPRSFQRAFIRQAASPN